MADKKPFGKRLAKTEWELLKEFEKSNAEFWLRVLKHG